MLAKWGLSGIGLSAWKHSQEDTEFKVKVIFGYKALAGWAREQTKPKTPKWDYVQKGRTPWVYVVTRDQQLKGKCVPGNLGGGSVSSYTVC